MMQAEDITIPTDIIDKTEKLIDEGDFSQAIDLIDDAESQFPENYYLRIQKGYATGCSGDYDAGIKEVTTIIDELPREIFGYQRLIKIHLKQRDFDAARSVAKKLRDEMPNSKEAQDFLEDIYSKYRGATNQSNAAGSAGVSDSMEKQLARTMNPRKKLKNATMLLARGEFDDARELYKDLSADRRVGGEASQFVKIAEKLQAKLDGRTVNRMVNRNKGVVYNRAEGSEKVLIVFGENQNTLGSMPMNILHHFLEGVNANVIYLLGQHRSLYMEGVPELADSYDETISSLKAKLEEWGVKDIYCAGAFTSGYAAIVYGVELQAKAVLTFSTLASVEEAFISKDPRSSKNNMLVEHLKNKIPDRLFDLKKLMSETDKAPKLFNYIGANHAEDRYHGEYLADLPNVSLEKIMGSNEHSVLPRLIAEDKFDDVIDLVINT